MLTVLKPLVTAACVESGVAGGLFTPTLTFGALLGGLLGKGWQLLWPELEIPRGTYAVLGSASLLAVSLQGPLAAAVFAIELMGSTDVIIVPVVLSGVIAVLISRFLHSPSVYTARLHKVENEDDDVADAVPLAEPEPSLPVSI